MILVPVLGVDTCDVSLLLGAHDYKPSFLTPAHVFPQLALVLYNYVRRVLVLFNVE